MRYRGIWPILLVALLFAPGAAADDDEDEDDDGVASGRGCGPLPVHVQDVSCETFEQVNEACDDVEDRTEDVDEDLSGKAPGARCGQFVPVARQVCFAVTRTPPGITYDIECWITYATKLFKPLIGEWKIDLEEPERY